MDEEVAAPLAVGLVRLGLGQPVARADKRREVPAARLLPRQEVGQAGAQEVARALEAEHPGHRQVALGDPGVAVEVLDLLRLRGGGGQGALEVETPDPLRALLEVEAELGLSRRKLAVGLPARDLVAPSVRMHG